MGGKPVVVVLDTKKAAEIKKWKVKEGMWVSTGQIIFIYDLVSPESNEKQLKFKSTQVGTVRKILAKEGDVVSPGKVLLELEKCKHPTVMKDMCAECGSDLRENEPGPTNASVPMVHSIPELKVSEEHAQIIGRADENRLISDRKLVLLVDLDKTLIHTTNDNIPPNLKDVYHFRLNGSNTYWYHTRIRPRTKEFLEEISKYYELHICTFGVRNYAHTIAMFLDPDGKYFSHRILSRDECFSANSKTANLKALFPCGDNMVCIIDDREDVWNFAANLIHVKPYHFFKHTGDINAPPGLKKNENDEIEGFDFSSLDKESKVEQKKEDSSQKKETNTSNSRSKMGTLGDSTTDKDTEDEMEKKSKPKIQEESKTEDIEKVREDLRLSKDEGDDTVVACEKYNEGSVAEKETKEEKIEEIKVIESKVEEKVPADSSSKVETNTSNSRSKTEDTPGNSTTDKDTEDEGEKISKTKVKEESRREDLEMVADDLRLSKDSEDNEASVAEKETSEEDSEKVKGTKEEEESKGGETEKTPEQEGDSAKLSETDVKSSDEQTDPKTDLIEVEDSDDYLIYLEVILKNIHKSYYEEYDKVKKLGETSAIPHLKEVIPRVKSQVLKGCHLVFSGLVPFHIPLEVSRAYRVAISLGATVLPDISPGCTHLVAARPGTAKVNSSRRHKGIAIVTPLWLWHCAERWQRQDERLYPLGRGGLANRIPPDHCGTDADHNYARNFENYLPPMESPQPSGRFIDTINPLLTFSSEDMKIMDQEVEDLFNEDESESELDKRVLKTKAHSKVPDIEESSTSSSEDSLSGASHPKGWSERKSRKRKVETTTCTETENDEEPPSVKFRRGEPLPSDLDLSDDSQDTLASDDGDSNMMEAALERKFLSGE